MRTIKSFVKKLIFSLLGEHRASRVFAYRELRYSSNGQRSFSQEGEDRILANLFRGKLSGFYVDIGAHHPHYLSNTSLFYQEGWTGINIDANPDCVALFKDIRHKDINLATGVGLVTSSLDFYKFEEPALSSFDRELSKVREGRGRKIKEVIKVDVLPLSKILAEHLPKNQQIDFMNIDVEGLDLQVLRSNDWVTYRPLYVVVECLGLDLENLMSDEIYSFLRSKNYQMISKLVNTCIFKDLSSDFSQADQRSE